jgi:hypothetical protein
MSETAILLEEAEIAKLHTQVGVIEQHYQKAMAKQSETNKHLVEEIEGLRKDLRTQREDHEKLWKWVKALEMRLIRAERNEPARPPA